MARKSKDTLSINRGLFADVYEDCCANDAERMILDVIMTKFLLKEVFKGDQATERAVAKITGLSKSGVRVVEARAMAKLKDMLNKQGIHSVEDVIDIDHGRSAADGGGSVDEKETVNEVKNKANRIQYNIYDISSFKANLNARINETGKSSAKPIKTCSSIEEAMAYIDDENGGYAVMDCFGAGTGDQLDEVYLYLTEGSTGFKKAGTIIDKFEEDM